MNNMDMETKRAKVRARITMLRDESQDVYFTQFLGRLLDDLDRGIISTEAAMQEVNRGYSLYSERMQGGKQAEGTQNAERAGEAKAEIVAEPAKEVATEPAQSSAMPPAKAAKAAKASSAEYAIGAIVLSVVGALFLLIAFITFGITYLDGIFQGILLYMASLAIIVFSELFVKKRLAKFAHGLTGLGVAALYASTIINYMYLNIFGSIIAVAVTIAVAAFSLLLSHKKDSAAFRLISVLGSYLSFLLIGPPRNDVEYLIAVGLIFIISVSAVFFVSHKHKGAINNAHMILNTLFLIIFSAMADVASAIFIVVGLCLNIIFLNIVYLKQEKTAAASWSFGLCTGALSIFILGLARDMIGLHSQLSVQIYYFLIIFAMMLAINVFFYISNQQRIAKAIIYYMFMTFLLLLLFIQPIDPVYVWGAMLMFSFSRLLKPSEYEGMYAILMLVAFGVGISIDGQWQQWIFVALALLNIPLIRRWRLFYQYAMSVYLVVVAYQVAPSFDYFLPAAALLLFILMPAFRYLPRAMEPGLIIKNDETASIIYNLTNLGALVLLSILCMASDQAWCGALTTLVGAGAIICYLSRAYYLEFSKKYLLLAAYLAVMTLFIRFPNPIYASVIMMLIATFCVGFGFWKRDKAQRICGLVLALFSCVKIALYDFRVAEAMQRMIVFMAVGAIALLISLIYIRMEKKASEGDSTTAI